jgi:hypothetical protein
MKYGKIALQFDIFPRIAPAVMPGISEERCYRSLMIIFFSINLRVLGVNRRRQEIFAKSRSPPAPIVLALLIARNDNARKPSLAHI